MIVVLPICPCDAELAYDLLGWIGQLSPCSQHDCLLVLDAAVDWAHALALSEVAGRVFRSCAIVATESPIVGWPGGANALWLVAAREAERRKTPFLWLEPDAIPLKKGWLDEIQKAYQGGYLGYIYDSNKEGLPPRVMSGIAVYPADARAEIEPLLGAFPTWAWDIAGTSAMVSHGSHTSLIHHFWGQPNLSPTFVEAKIEGTPINAFTLEMINKDAVIFHRNKDGTLLSELRRQLVTDLPELPPTPGDLVVVLPFCNVDAELMVKLLEWMQTMGMAKTHACMLSYDLTTIRHVVPKIQARAAQVFSSVGTTSYRMRKGTAFPQTAAWQHAARTMAGVNRPWVWLEADNVVLKRDWLLRLQAEYQRGKKPFAGPIMPGRGHMNGSGMYPANTPSRLPRTMSHTNNAWDVEMQTEMISDCHNIEHLWQCAWGVVRGRLDPIQGETLPSFPRGSPLLLQIRKNAVVFHRDKSGTLIQRLRETLRK